MTEHYVSKIDNWDVAALEPLGIIVDNPNTLVVLNQPKEHYRKTPQDFFEIGHSTWSGVFDRDDIKLEDLAEALTTERIEDCFHNIGVFDGLLVRQGYLGNGYESALIQGTLKDMKTSGKSLSLVVVADGSALGKSFEAQGFEKLYIVNNQACYVKKL